jgi:hypothetical protein
VRKPNYRFERAERDRLKQANKEDKARRQTGAGVGSEIDKKGLSNQYSQPLAACRT